MTRSRSLMYAGAAAIAAVGVLGAVAFSRNGDTQSDGAMLMSAGALAFDDSNTLFVGDGKAGLVHAFDLGADAFDNQSDYQLGRAQTFEGRTLIEDLDVEIAALMGANAEDIKINDMVVHKPSKQIFMSVHRGHGPDAEPAILKVDEGELALVDLEAAAHTSASVGAVPTEETLEFGQMLSQLAITDIDYYEGELIIAGVSNEEFSSKLRRMPYPFTNELSTTSVEIWHAVHAQYETRAPIINQTIMELNGEPTLIAVYACTPIVRIPLSDLKDGAEIRGTMIGEMGFGNTPIDIVPYVNAWDGTSNVVVTNTNRSAASINVDAIASAPEMPHGEGVQPVFAVAGVSQYELPMTGNMHLDTVDETWAVTIRRAPEDPNVIQLHTLPMPFFFDRADHIVEMNWADGPDPFGYKAAPPLTYN